jgi:hypothetical protein
MKRRSPRVEFSVMFHTTGLAFLLLLVFSAGSYAQEELRADRQILLESTHGTVTVKKGPRDKLYVLNRSVVPSSSIWVSDYSGTSMRRILGGGREPTDLRAPKDLAVDRDGNAIVVDGSIKIFAGDGKFLSSFPFHRPESVGVLSDGRILVSGLPNDRLISVFDRQGRLLGGIGEPLKVDDDPFFNAVLNVGSIVVDEHDNIYYVFRFLLTPTVRKYTREGKLVAEWHPQGGHVDQVVAKAKKTYEDSKVKGSYGGNSVLSAAAFDSETKTLWVASGPQISQLDSSGRTVRNLKLLRLDGGQMQIQGLIVDRDFIRAATFWGVLEFFKPH